MPREKSDALRHLTSRGLRIEVGVGQSNAIDLVVSVTLRVATSGPGFIDLTHDISNWLDGTSAQHGGVTVFVRHTSASLTIQENADPTVLQDLSTVLDELAPRDANWWHDTEGPDDMPAHVKTMLTATSLQIPVIAGKLALGVWQAVYLIEHRDRPQRREVVLQFIGASAKNMGQT